MKECSNEFEMKGTSDKIGVDNSMPVFNFFKLNLSKQIQKQRIKPIYTHVYIENKKNERALNYSRLSR